ncbi:MAG TPA: type II toxin-antitoxin system RelE/ParE family toxin [Thermoanaerobaculia bacterium]|nr:type II toxin-antitoxin system RelE/ParE family toxin [Thermoanaerobaculia bacterium]
MSFAREIEVSELADRQIREADSWWRKNRQRAPNAIREELEKIRDVIAFQPHIGERARNVKLPGVRRLHLQRIHYHIYYRVIGEPERVEIVAFWNVRRGSGPPI